MITFRVRYDLDRVGLISALCWTQREVDGDDELPSWSKAEVERQVRDALVSTGRESIYFWGDGVDDEDVERITDWATECVDRVWPNA